MSIIIDREISALCDNSESPLLTKFVSWDNQLQPCGFDFTIANVTRPLGGGIIRAEIGQNVRAASEPAKIDSEGYFHLSTGYYVVEFNEVLHLPNDVVAFAFPRSTLIRYGGSLVSGVWDAGFKGKSYCGLMVHAPNGLQVQKNSMLMQMVFHRLSGESAGFKYNHLHKA